MIYLIHFDKKLHHSQHYLGFAEDSIEARFDQHCKGNGAKILRRCNEWGIEYKIVAIFEGDRNLERKMKNGKNLKKYCPHCKELYYAESKRRKKEYRKQKKLQILSIL